MKVVIVNASPKAGKSNSGAFAQGLEDLLAGCEVARVRLNRARFLEEDLQRVKTCDALVIFYPLYVDGLPSHLLRALQGLENAFDGVAQGPMVYGFANCGLYEGHQAYLSLQMLCHWCARAGLAWGRGAAIGAGEMLGQMGSLPMDKGPRKSLGKLLGAMAQSITKREGGEDLFADPAFPRWGYLQAAHLSWNMQAKGNGLRKKQLLGYPDSE